MHSDWVLDPLFEAMGRVAWLHGAYEATYGALLQCVYALVGPGLLRSVAPLVAGVAAADSAQIAHALRLMAAGLNEFAASWRPWAAAMVVAVTMAG